MVEQQNLQQRILNIISNQNAASPLPQTPSSGHNMTSNMTSNMPAVVSRNQTSSNAMSSTSTSSQAQSTQPNTYINFDNPSVQKALDSLISSGPNLLKSISMVSGNNSSNSQLSQHNSMMPNRMNNSQGGGNYNGGGGNMTQGGTNQNVNSQNNSNTFQGQNMMGGNQPTQNQGYRHPLMGTQISTPGQGQFFNQRGGSGMRY